MSQGRLDTLADLTAVIGKAPPAIDLKVIDHLDETARHWLTQSPLMFCGFGDEAGLSVTLAGGVPGFATADAATLNLPLDTLDDPALAQAGQRFGSLFLAPGIGETLRINGHVAAVTSKAAVITVTECYVHCAKALIRSGFWGAEPIDDVSDDPARFIDATRFMALATMDGAGNADLSPKGDPAGCMARLEEGVLLFADRPGNKRVDSFRNILAQPRISAALLVPGSTRILLVQGRAQLLTDAEKRAAFTVQGKTPLLVTQVSDIRLQLKPSPALERARLWPLAGKAEGINPAHMFAAHLKLNKNKGLGARLASAVVSIPGLMQKGLDSDYKSNLY